MAGRAYLAALYLREGGPPACAVVTFGGDDRLVSDYLESEFLSRIPARQRVFLTRTAVLERMCGPLCDAVLQISGSAGILADLAGSNLLLVPLDRRGQWYRYHHLFRDMLLAELERCEPGLIRVLRRRAAGVPRQWHARGGAGVFHGRRGRRAGRPPGRAAHGAGGQPAGPGHHRPAVVRVAGRPGRDRGPPDDRGAGLAAVRADGQAVDALRWADAVDRWQYGNPARPDPSAEAWAALLRAVLCRTGSGRCVPTPTRPCAGSPPGAS